MDELAHTSGLPFDAQRMEDRQVLSLWTGGLAYMQGLSAGLLKDRRDPDLPRELPAQGVPASVNALVGQLAAKDLHELIGQHGEEQVTVGPRFLVVLDRPQAQFGFE